MPTPADLAFWSLANRRAARMTPDMAAAVLRAFAVLRATITDAELQGLLATHALDAIVDAVTKDATMQPAMAPVQEQIRRALGRSIAQTARSFPRPPGGPPMPPITPTSTVSVGFDVLNPRIVDGIRTMETKVISSLTDDVKATVRQVVERGLHAGVGPKAIAKELRASIGLGPTQEQEVTNFRAALRGQDGRSPFDYLKRDRRYDATLKKALGADGNGLSDSQVETMVDAYRKRRIAQNAETVSRTAMLDAQKTGQHLAIADAVDKGVYDPSRLVKTWVGVMDSRERPEHVAMEGETVPWDQPYSTGEMTPGSSTFNCRCVSRYAQRPAGA